MICKDLVSWVKKISMTKEVAFFKNCRFPFKNYQMKIYIIAKLVVDIWGKCSNGLCQSAFPERNTLKIFLFLLFFRKFVNSLLIIHKISLQNMKPFFPVILRIFDRDCYSFKIAFVKFGHLFLKFRKRKSLELDINLSIFPILWGKFFFKIFKMLFWMLDDVIRLEFGKLFPSRQLHS